MKPLEINIPTPCHEDWQAMEKVGSNERHCAACVRNLTDFSTYTDREIHQHLAHQNGRLCGRFRPDQLGRPILAEPVRASRWRTWLTAGSILLSSSIAAQLEAPHPKVEIAAKAPLPIREFNLNGVVTDAEGNALVGATVAIYTGKWLTHGVVTDFDGSFTLKAQAGDTARISFMGFKTETVGLDAGTVLHDPFLDVVMEESVLELDAVVVTGYGLLGKIDLSGMVGGIRQTSSARLINGITETLPPVYATYLQQASIFPNPFTTHLDLDFTARDPGTLKAELFGTDGRNLYQWPAEAFLSGHNTRRFQLRKDKRLVPGHYFLRLEDGAGRVEMRIVIRR